MIKKSFKTFLYLIATLLIFQSAYALNVVKLSPEYFPNTSKGKALSSADIYVGKPDLDPEIVANQKTLSVQQEDGTIVAVTQPISTGAGGVPLYLGSPVTLLVEGDYSLKVLDSSGSQIYYIPSTAYEQYLVSGNYYYPDYSEADQGVVGGGNSVTDILTEVGAVTNATIYFSHNSGAATTTYTFTTNTTITGNFNVIVEEGVILDGAGTLTLPKSFNPRQYQVFGSSITIVGLTYGIPQWWGALGDDTNDDTAEIQAAIVATLSTTGGRLYFPDGTYKITSALTFVQYDGFVIQGQSQGGTFIKQYTSDTPIFQFTKENTHTFEISDIYFKYDTQQTSTETESVAIYFDFDTSVGAGAYNFQVRRCQFDNVYKGIGLDNVANHSIWGCSFEHLVYNNTCTGPIIDVWTTISIGRPNISARHIYIRADSIENAQPIMRFQGVNALSLDNIEYNNINNGATALIVQGGCTGNIRAIRVAGATYTTTADNFLEFSDSLIHIGTIHFGAGTVNVTGANEYFTLIKSSGDTFLDIGGIDITSFTLTDGDAWILFGGVPATQSVKIGYIHNIGNFVLTNIESSSSGATISVEDWNKPSISADNGDANLAISVGDEQVQMFETTLTADRTVTLPEHEVNGTNVFNGLTYKIVRTSGAGAFTLYVKDNDGNTIGSIAPSKKGAITVMYRRIDWELIGDEEW